MQVVGDETRVGTVLAGYRVEGLIGRGATGYIARDLDLDRQVVLRLVAPEPTEDEHSRERFLRESMLAASLEHPNVLPVYEAGEADGLIYAALGYVEGVDLASLLAHEGQLGSERALAIIAQLAEALDAARWGRGLVHGSLAPSNVLVAPAADTGWCERIYLLGFGLRRGLPPGALVAEAVQQIDTLGYLAPEQIEGKPLSPRTDIYALGCVLFECLTGQAPFERDSPGAVLGAHLYEPPPSARVRCPGLPAAIDGVIARALAKSPEERYSTCGELAASARASVTPGEEHGERAAARQLLSAGNLLSRPAWAMHETAQASRATWGAPVVAPNPLSERSPPPGAADEGSIHARERVADRLRKRRGASIAAVGFVVLVAALAVAAVWLIGGGRDDRRSATGEPGATETLEPAVSQGAVSVEPPGGVLSGASEGDGSLARIVSLGAGSLVRIDAGTGEIVARVAMPDPFRLASDGGSVWVLSGEGRDGQPGIFLLRVDTKTNAVREIFDASVSAVLRLPWLAAAGGSAWVAGEEGAIHRFDQGTSLAKPVEFGSDMFSQPFTAEGSLWVGSGGDLLRVDPTTGTVVDRIPAAGTVAAAGAGFLWTVSPMGNAPGVVRIDTETGERVPIGTLKFPWGELTVDRGLVCFRTPAEVQKGCERGELTVARGAVWAASPGDGTIVRLDPVTGKELGRVRVGRGVTTLTAGGGAVWAALGTEPHRLGGPGPRAHVRPVARYDIATGRVGAIDVGGVPADLDFAGDSVWVAVAAPQIEDYVAWAEAICKAANRRYLAALARLDVPSDSRAWKLGQYQAVAAVELRFSQATLAQLRGLSAPEAFRPALESEFSLREQEIGLIRRYRAAAAAGDLARVEELSMKRVDLTHRRSGYLPSECPVALGA